MKLVRFIKDVAVYSAFAGEVMAFDDEVAENLIRRGKAVNPEVKADDPAPPDDSGDSGDGGGDNSDDRSAGDGERDDGDDGETEEEDEAVRRSGRSARRRAGR